MQRVKILQGLPASGKTTWAKSFCEQNQDWVRISRDDLRRMRGKYWIPKQEDLITEFERSTIKHTLDQGLNVVVDATNLNPKYLENLKLFIKENGGVSEIVKFDADVNECIRRDSLREDSVGSSVIWGMYRKYFKEGDDLKKKKLYESNRNPGKRKSIICDVDGTIASMKNRSPYEWDKVDQDEPKMDVIEIIKSHKDQGYQIIFLTGRDGNQDCKDKTIYWIEKYFGWEYKKDFILHIRAENDSRKDSVVKIEIFEKYIKPNFDVLAVYDDRDQVVSMWRNELGLTCFQVDYGNF